MEGKRRQGRKERRREGRREGRGRGRRKEGLMGGREGQERRKQGRKKGKNVAQIYFHHLTHSRYSKSLLEEKQMKSVDMTKANLNLL